ADSVGGTQERGPGVTRVARAALLLFALAAPACLQCRAVAPSTLVVSLTSGPNNLDPRMGTDDASQKIHQLIFDNFMELDDHLRVVPRLAERLDHPDPLTY